MFDADRHVVQIRQDILKIIQENANINIIYVNIKSSKLVSTVIRLRITTEYKIQFCRKLVFCVPILVFTTFFFYSYIIEKSK